MATLRHPFFILCILLFCLNQALEHRGIFVWPLHTHLDDLLCLPITLTAILATERLYFQNPYFVLPSSYLLAAVLLFSLVFELLLPFYSARYTADVWDVVAYAVGALLFQRIINQPLYLKGHRKKCI